MNCAILGTKTKRPHRRMMLVDMTDENYQTMLMKHKRRKLEDPVCYQLVLFISPVFFVLNCKNMPKNMV